MKTLSELSKQFNIPIATLKSAAQDGRITARKSGGTWLVAEDELWERFLKNHLERVQKK